MCRAAREELNAWMVCEGWAFAYQQYSRAYVAEEEAARAARRGIWRGEFVAPWDWRRGERLAGPRQTPLVDIPVRGPVLRPAADNFAPRHHASEPDRSRTEERFAARCQSKPNQTSESGIGR